MSAERTVPHAAIEYAPRRQVLARLHAAAGRWAAPMLIVLLALGAWELCVLLFEIRAWLLPAPSAIAVALFQDAGLLARHSWVTLEEVIVGFGAALLCGVSLGVGIALSRTVERSLYPFVIASQTIPIIVNRSAAAHLVRLRPHPQDHRRRADSVLPTGGKHRGRAEVRGPGHGEPAANAGREPPSDTGESAAALGFAVPVLRREGGRRGERHRRGHRRVGGVQRGPGLPDDPLEAPVSDRARLRRDSAAVRHGRWSVPAGWEWSSG